MLTSYFKVAWRNIFKHKGYTIVNIVNLSIALAVCLLVAMYVAYESSYDRFLPNYSRIYRVPVKLQLGDTAMQIAGLPMYAPAIQQEIPEVELAGRLKLARGTEIKLENKTFKEDNCFFADPQILQIFSFRFVSGGRDIALRAPNAIAISQRMAEKYFAAADATGKTLQFQGQLFTIGGVFAAFPRHSHFNPDILVAFDTQPAVEQNKAGRRSRMGVEMTYLLLKPGASALHLDQKLNLLYERHSNTAHTEKTGFIVQPLAAIHWDVETHGDIGAKGNRLYIIMFSTIAALLLLIACFNFISLTIARFMERMREVAVRKVIGALRRQLILQLIVESALVAGMALALGVCVFRAIYPPCYRFLKADVVFAVSHIAFMAVFLVCIFVVTGLLAPIYPAVTISRFSLAAAVKNNLPLIKRLPFRQTLVTIQFAMTIALIFATLAMTRQMRFVKANLGFDKDNVALVTLPSPAPDLQRQYTIFRDLLEKNTAIKAVSGALTVPGSASRSQTSLRQTGQPADHALQIQELPVDYGFIQALGLTLTAGRDFSRAYTQDASSAVILNEAAVSALNLRNPIGATLLLPGENTNAQVQVIGVVRNFHLASLHHQIEPCYLQIDPESYTLCAIAFASNTRIHAIDIVRPAWKQAFGAAELNIKYLNDSYDALYKADETSAIMLAFFMTLVIFISCIGLFGMASFVIGRRRKEIGVRKVFGATSAQILTLLSFNLVKWLWVSCALAWPCGYYFSQQWLNRFAYRVPLGPDLFLLSGGAALLIALAAISQQTVDAMRTNPIETLKYE